MSSYFLYTIMAFGALFIIYLIAKKLRYEIKTERLEEKKDVIVNSLAPKLTEDYLTLDYYIGQTNIIEYLKGHIRYSKLHGNPLPHIILWGNGGLGKSTLIKAVANDIGGRFIEIVPANLRSIKDLHDLLFKKRCNWCGHTNPFTSSKCLSCGNEVKISYSPVIQLVEKDIVFLEECHGLKPDIEEAMYSLMQDGYMVLRFNGVDQRVVFPRITIAGATTKLGDLSKPFRDRFKLEIALKPYSLDEISVIIKKYAQSKGTIISEAALKKISEISYGIPRIAKKYIDDCIALKTTEKVEFDTISHLLFLLKVDENGLTEIHRKILSVIHVRGSAGASSIASSVGVTADIYLEVYEPGLIYLDYIMLGGRGRVLTENALQKYFPNCDCKKCLEYE